MSAAARPLAEGEHSWDAAAEATERLYRRLLEERRDERSRWPSGSPRA